MGHHHHHGTSTRIGWAFFLNLTFTIIEFIGGLLTNSTAIMADAVHDLGDTLSIGSAWLLDRLSKKEANHSFTYGYRRLSLLGALLNALVLIAGSVWILFQTIPRLLEPQMPHTEGMMGLAVLGVVMNGYAAYKLHGGQTLNEKVLNWHLIEDVMGWVAVLIVAITMHYVNWPILDPLLSLLFTLFILFNVFRNLKSTVKLFFQAAPEKALTGEVTDQLLQIPAIASIHHLHIWSLDGEHHIATLHAIVKCETLDDYRTLKQQVAQTLDRFDFTHTTVEFELLGEDCRDALLNE